MGEKSNHCANCKYWASHSCGYGDCKGQDLLHRVNKLHVACDKFVQKSRLLEKVDVCGDCRLYKNGAFPADDGYCDRVAKSGKRVQVGTLACAHFNPRQR